MTQRDVMGREVGGGFMFGSSCTPVADSCQCMAKPIQYCKVKIKIKKKRTLKKKSEDLNMHFFKEDVQMACEKMLNITNHQGKAIQNHNEILPHTCQDDYQQKDTNSMSARMWRKGNLCTQLMGR